MEQNDLYCLRIKCNFFVIYPVFHNYGLHLELCFDEVVCFLQHTRFVQECKDAEPDVLFVGDSMVQLMQQFEVRQDIIIDIVLITHMIIMCKYSSMDVRLRGFYVH